MLLEDAAAPLAFIGTASIAGLLVLCIAVLAASPSADAPDEE